MVSFSVSVPLYSSLHSQAEQYPQVPGGGGAWGSGVVREKEMNETDSDGDSENEHDSESGNESESEYESHNDNEIER